MKKFETTPFPLITIAMPIKNREWALQYVLKSIEKQDYPKKYVKVVFVDNYSTDGTYDTLVKWKEIMEKHYHSIALVREEGNIAHLRNKCIDLAEGKYLIFWDSDIVAPKFIIRRMVELAELRGDAGMIVATFHYADVDYVPVIESLADGELKVKEVIGAGTGFTLIRLDVFRQVGGFNEKLTVGEDTDFSYRLLEKTHYKILRIDTEVLHLKHRDVILPRAHQGLSRWVRYNFYQRSEEYFLTYASLPKHLKIRLVYWLLFPSVIGGYIAIMLSSNSLLKILAIIALPLYLLPSICLNIIKQGIRDGLVMWAKFNLPTGLALSYGFLLKALKELLRKRNGH
ncbi:MAG: glycosyltransferase [Desulfurococcaceae archaeon]